MKAGNAPPLYLAIRTWLDAEGVSYRALEHEATRTCEESARARGESLNIGGKCLLLKAGESFGLYALSAALHLDSRRLMRGLGERRLRFASAEELLELTGLVPGTLPPLGPPILPLPLHADESIARSERIAFNAGSPHHSLILSTADYLRVARPRLLNFARPAEA